MSTAYPYTEKAWAEIEGKRCEDCGVPFFAEGPIAVFTLGSWRHARHGMVAERTNGGETK